MTRSQSTQWMPYLIAVLLVALVARGMLERRSAEPGDVLGGNDTAGVRGAGTEAADSATPAQRLMRVFAIDIEVCRCCGGRLRVIASIEAAAAAHRNHRSMPDGDGPKSRA